MSAYLGIFATHPIQYHVPLWRKLAARDDIRIHVYYGSDMSVRGGVDHEFGVPVKWDVPLLEGYPSTFMTNVSKVPGVATGFRCMDCPEIYDILRREQFDAVLVHGYSMLYCWQIFRAAWREGIPVMIRGDSREGAGVRKKWYFEMTRSAILRYLYKRTAIGLAVGKYMERHFIRLGIPPERVVHCPHCIDTELFDQQREHFLPLRNSIRAELGIPADAPVVLFCGKFIPVKQPLVFARGLGAMRNRDRVWAIIVGEGEMRPEFEAGCRDAIGERAKFVGFVNQSQLGRYYMASDVFVISSFKETWGLVVNEAMTMGLAIVASNKIGCREDLMIDGKTGLLFQFDDPNSLGGCLDRVVDSPELRAALGRAAREHIAGYSTDAAVAGIVEGVVRAQRYQAV